MRRYMRGLIVGAAITVTLVACADPRPLEPTALPVQARGAATGPQPAAPSNTNRRASRASHRAEHVVLDVLEPGLCDHTSACSGCGRGAAR